MDRESIYGQYWAPVSDSLIKKLSFPQTISAVISRDCATQIDLSPTNKVDKIPLVYLYYDIVYCPQIRGFVVNSVCIAVVSSNAKHVNPGCLNSVNPCHWQIVTKTVKNSYFHNTS